MLNPISSIMVEDFKVLPLDSTLAQARAFFSKYRLHSAPVVDVNGQCFGILSSIDLLHFCNEGENFQAKLTWEVCTHEIVKTEPQATIAEATNLMVEKNVSQLIVLEGKTIIGVLSGVDVLKSITSGKVIPQNAGG
ncbi:MAG: hypothetical protein COA96_06055 [SAR86 cluster bacterium]|uniref:CBS domain-containing protein n=1 Tax=SAR86 cluster bacterium TaxID=2030880 RepID=A0A2A5B3X4_9GAMM|nr:MAG: hypothetical protein COA96_06055 [SAR86 cluster bacterium]